MTAPLRYIGIAVLVTVTILGVSLAVKPFIRAYNPPADAPFVQFNTQNDAASEPDAQARLKQYMQEHSR
jgi:hypothetical protein